LIKVADVNAKNKYGDTPLIFASNNGFFEIVNHLLASGAVIDIKNELAITPLILASAGGFKKYCRTSYFQKS
jgi:ankyrin repeat protein